MKVTNRYILKTIYKLFLLVKPKKRKKLIYILFCILVAGISEMITLASFIPFLLIVTNPSEIHNLQYIGGFLNYLDVYYKINLVLLISIIFGLAILISGFIRLYNIWLIGRFSASIGSDFSSQLYDQILGRSYQSHIKENSSEAINTLTLHINNVVGVFVSTLQVSAAFFMSAFIFLTLLFINYKISLLAFILILTLYLIIYKFVYRKLIKNSYLVSENNRRKLQIVQESLGSIKDIIISNNQSRFSDDFKNYDRETRKNIALSNFLSLFPRVTIESLALLALVSFSVIFLLNSSNNNDLIIIIGSLGINMINTVLFS